MLLVRVPEVAEYYSVYTLWSTEYGVLNACGRDDRGNPDVKISIGTFPVNSNLFLWMCPSTEYLQVLVSSLPTGASPPSSSMQALNLLRSSPGIHI